MRFESVDKGIATGLTIRHDNVSQYVSRALLDDIHRLGIDSSPSFVRSPEGNGCPERFICTLKENLRWLETYSCIEDLQRSLQWSKDEYNERWLRAPWVSLAKSAHTRRDGENPDRRATRRAVSIALGRYTEPRSSSSKIDFFHFLLCSPSSATAQPRGSRRCLLRKRLLRSNFASPRRNACRRCNGCWRRQTSRLTSTPS